MPEFDAFARNTLLGIQERQEGEGGFSHCEICDKKCRAPHGHSATGGHLEVRRGRDGQILGYEVTAVSEWAHPRLKGRIFPVGISWLWEEGLEEERGEDDGFLLCGACHKRVHSLARKVSEAVGFKPKNGVVPWAVLASTTVSCVRNRQVGPDQAWETVYALWNTGYFDLPPDGFSFG